MIQLQGSALTYRQVCITFQLDFVNFFQENKKKTQIRIANKKMKYIQPISFILINRHTAFLQRSEACFIIFSFFRQNIRHVHLYLNYCALFSSSRIHYHLLYIIYFVNTKSIPFR